MGLSNRSFFFRRFKKQGPIPHSANEFGKRFGKQGQSLNSSLDFPKIYMNKTNNGKNQYDNKDTEEKRRKKVKIKKEREKILHILEVAVVEATRGSQTEPDINHRHIK